MDGAREPWSGAWLVPFLLLSMQGRILYGHQLLERMAERFLLAYEEQPTYGVLR